MKESKREQSKFYKDARNTWRELNLLRGGLKIKLRDKKD